VPVDQIPIGVPVSVRSADDPRGGNKFAAAKLAASIGETEPATRIALIRDFMRSARDEPAMGVIDAMSPVLSRLPARLIVQLTAEFANSLDLQASNVPGLTRPAYISGGRVTHIYAFGPRPGCAAMTTLVSHDGTCCIAGNINPDAITEVELFERCLQDGFQEIVDLAASSAN